jgi:hypothetical protein
MFNLPKEKRVGTAGLVSFPPYMVMIWKDILGSRKRQKRGTKEKLGRLIGRDSTDNNLG